MYAQIMLSILNCFHLVLNGLFAGLETLQAVCEAPEGGQTRQARQVRRVRDGRAQDQSLHVRLTELPTTDPPHAPPGPQRQSQ